MLSLFESHFSCRLRHNFLGSGAAPNSQWAAGIESMRPPVHPGRAQRYRPVDNLRARPLGLSRQAASTLTPRLGIRTPRDALPPPSQPVRLPRVAALLAPKRMDFIMLTNQLLLTSRRIAREPPPKSHHRETLCPSSAPYLGQPQTPG